MEALVGENYPLWRTRELASNSPAGAAPDQTQRRSMAPSSSSSSSSYCSLFFPSWRGSWLGLVAFLATAAASYGSSSAAAPSTRFRPTAWSLAHATFYGDETATETMGGACGYGNLYNSGYGTSTAALSTVLFRNGYACGACFQIRCVSSPWCYRGSPIATVTATNLCPPNWAEPSDDGGWCNPPRTHFDMSKPAFMQIAQWKAGIVPVMYRRVPCVKRGGIRFTFQGNSYWLLVYVMNVGGAGDVAGMWVKGSRTGWISMSHNWGASYQAFATLQGQALSFKLASYSTRQTIVAWNVAPPGWTVGMTYQANANFH